MIGVHGTLGIVTVVDAFHLPKNLSLGGPWRGFAPSPTAQPGMPDEAAANLATADATCAAQIAYADRVVLNKVSPHTSSIHPPSASLTLSLAFAFDTLSLDLLPIVFSSLAPFTSVM